MSDLEPFDANARPPHVVDLGPTATHDQTCAVCWERKAVLDVPKGLFQPCWACQREGWKLTHHRWRKRKR